jgi:GTP cyclohydrolase IA
MTRTPPVPRSLPQPPPLADAVENLLLAMGLDPQHDDLRETPRRVAELWSTEFLSGYAMDPVEILSRPVVGEGDPDAVFLTDLSFHSLCPHHLLPCRGRAHVVYIPDGKLLGFGRIARLVACFTQRLTLQERATQQIAQALVEHLPCRGAGCVMEAEHLCLALPGEQHQASRVTTSAFAGELRHRPDLRDRLMAAIGHR